MASLRDMTTPDSASHDPRLRALEQDQQQRRARFFLTFAVIEGIVLAAAVIAIFVLELVDPDIGVFVLVAIAAVGGGVMAFSIMSQNRRFQRERQDMFGY